MAKRRKSKSKRRGNDRKKQKKQRRKLLARVTRDNKITRKERKKLQKRGISSNKARNYQINKSRQPTNSRRAARMPASVAREKIYTPLKIKGKSSGWGGKSSSSSSRSNSSSSSGAPRDTGKFVDIRNALREDSRSGQDAASSLDSRAVDQPNSYQSIIDDLRAQTEASEAAYQQQLTQQAEASAASLASLNDLFVGSIGEVESRMAQQQQDFNNAQAYANEQLNAANNAFLAEQKRSANMANAYVPQANPTASSIGYGDGRRVSRRKRQDNQLSDLTLLSGLGTITSPLSGLQLA
jgi:hypothetical protein